MEYNVYINCGDRQYKHTVDTDDTSMYTIELTPLNIQESIVLELWDNKWVFVSRGNVQFYKTQRNTQTGKTTQTPVTTVALVVDTVFNAVVQLSGTRIALQIAVQSADTAAYVMCKYRIAAGKQLVVGNDKNCDIVYESRVINPKHFSISYTGEDWTLQTANNVYVCVNNKRVTGTLQLEMYATITCYNMVICCMQGMCAVNKVAQVRLAQVNQLDMLQAASATEAVEQTYYMRTPRMLRELDTEEITIETPPAKRTGDETPWLLSIGPSFTMMLPMMASMLVNMTMNSTKGGSLTSYIGICISMGMSALMNAGWGIGRKVWQTRKDKKEEAKRQKKYRAYLSEKQEELLQREDDNRNILASEYLATAVYLDAIAHEADPHLWTMNTHHEDYGTVRLGTGIIKNPVQINAPKKHFVLEEDDLEQAVIDLADEHKYVASMPVTFNLRTTTTVGIVGDNSYVRNFAHSLLVQIAHTHSYVDAKICMCADDIIPELLDCRFMPHTFTDDGSRRLLAYSTDTLERLVGYLTNVIATRSEIVTENSTDNIPAITPLIVVFCYTPHILAYDAIRKYLDNGLPLGVTFVLLFGNIALLPNSCKYIIENTDGYKGAYAVDDIPDTDTDVTFDLTDETELANYAKRLGQFAIQEAAAGVLPNSVEFLSLLGIGNLAKYDLRQAYRKHDTSKNIKGLLGMGHNGTYWLDIHEKQAGPHGLVAGTTGSGKSELLQTLILSWALSYSPAELAFVLIDYKGGGMANIFAKLPHTAGVITNLSADDEDTQDSTQSNNQDSMQKVLTVRALTSIKAEIKHRQAVFKTYGVNHIDAYIQLYKQGRAEEPLPHLIIIVDEFAELRKEQHDFITDLVSAARVGRSLGVHLILATQKPAGVVDDEIWSNTRFRACLRVQDKQDSMGMLKRPEAAALTQIGRMYLQVGADEIFEEIQCAYTGAEYHPTDDGALTEAQICEMVQLDGTALQYQQQKNGDAETQLDASVAYIINSCTQYKIAAARKLWLPVLPMNLVLEDVLADVKIPQDGVYAVIGLVDDVVRQQQSALIHSVLAMSNCAIVGSAGCGKTTFIQTMLYDLAMRYTPDDVQFYICDYSSGVLKAFDTLPHCGGVMNDAYTSEERVKRLLRMLNSICDERRKLFDEVGVGNHEAYCKLKKLPAILFVIDNYMQWTTAHENLLPTLQQAVREYPKYGIHVIMTVNSGNELKFTIRQYIQQYYTITLPDTTSYREFNGSSPSTLPPRYKGRGVVPYGGILAEYQTALPLHAENEALRNNAVRCKLQLRAEELRKQGCTNAPAIPSIPYGVAYNELLSKHNLLTAQAVHNRKLFYGYAVETLEPMYLDLTQTYVYMVSDFIADMVAAQHFMENILYTCTAYRYQQVILNYGLSKTLKHSNTVTECTTVEQILKVLLTLNELFTKRTQIERPEYIRNGGTIENYQREVLPYIVYIPDIMTLIDCLRSSEMGKAQMELYKTADDLVPVFEGMLRNGAGYGVYFIIGCDMNAHKNKFSDKICAAVLATKTFIHFGGALNELKNCAPHISITQQMKTTEDVTAGYTVIKNDDIFLWIP